MRLARLPCGVWACGYTGMQDVDAPFGPRLTMQVLEALPRIYPFVHPHLALSPIASAERWTDDGARVGEADGSHGPVYARADELADKYRLPRAEEVRRWQAERDALEEQVLRFDDGDLGRMKDKTRGEL